MLTRVLRRFRRARSVSAGIIGQKPLEQLEPRFMLAAPRVIDISADNRGLVVLTLDQPLKASTVHSKSAALYTTSGSKDRKVKSTVSYSADSKQITIAAALKPDTSYKIYLSSRLIRGADGLALDGEFIKHGKPTGNGKPGGDLLVTTKPAPATKLVARFYTIFGNIDVRLFATQAQLTVQNFLRYANATGKDAAYSYDNTFFHRSVPGFVIQGGGFKVDPDNELTIVKQRPAVPNEPPSQTGAPGNIRGTIAMAKLGGNANSATNQWFFNLADNRANLDNQNGGFAVFGKITSKAGLAIVDRIAALKRFNLDPGNANTPFTDTPLVNDGEQAVKRGSLDPQADLVIVRRVATLMPVYALPKPKPAKAG